MSDMLFGAIVLVIFLVFVFIAGYFLYRFKNARLTNAWGPLIGVVNGKVVGDGGGAATSWLTGSYRGLNVQASMVPNRNRYSGEDAGSGTYHYFDVALANTPGRQDWSVQYDRAILGIGQTGWRVRAKDSALATALEAAGILSLVTPWGEPPSYFSLPTLSYSSRTQLLRYAADNGATWTPTTQGFTELLELLRQAAEINARVNLSA